jgi:ubiquinone biosynthesis protein
LQDKLPPFPTGCRPPRGRDTRWNGPLDALFSEFRNRRRGLHRAGAQGAAAGPGRDVAVKVLRPGVERAFRKDIDAFYLIAWVIETLSPASPPVAAHAT